MNIHILRNHIANISRNEYNYFLKLPNVNGVGFGYKYVNNFCTGEPCIHVLVKEKVNKDTLNKDTLIPSEFMGIKTDVIDFGIPKPNSLNNGSSQINVKNKDFNIKVRPLQLGCSICADIPGAATSLKGSIGAIVTRGSLIKDYFILSNNHILANDNVYPLGTKILQPSFSGGGISGVDTVATLSEFKKIYFITQTEEPENQMDAAIAKLVKKSFASNYIPTLGKLTGSTKAISGLDAWSIGSTTGITKTKIVNTNVTFILDYPNGKSARFVDQITTKRVTEQGDSGGLLIDKNRRIIGLSFSGTKSYSLYNDIELVLKYFKVNLYTN